MQDYERASHELALLIRRVMAKFHAFEHIPRTYGTNCRIYPSEMYALEATGGDRKMNVTRLAEYLGVTKGAVSQTLSKLTKKGLVRRGGTEGNAKEVRIELTAKGRKAFDNAMAFYTLAYQVSERLYGSGFHAQTRKFREMFLEFERFITQIMQVCPQDPAVKAKKKT